MKEKKPAAKITLTALFAALMTAGTYIKIPLGPVPVVLTTLFTVGAWSCIGSCYGNGSSATVSSSWSNRTSCLLGRRRSSPVSRPHWRFSRGLYFISPDRRTYHSFRENHPLLRMPLELAAASAVIYLPGLPWLMRSLDIRLSRGLEIGFIPFILGDILKGIIIFLLLRRIRKSLPEYFSE